MQLSNNGGDGLLVGAVEHGAGALERRSEGGKNIGGRALQTDGVNLDEGIVLKCVVIENGHGLGVAINYAGNAHVTGIVELLNAGEQAGGLGLEGHVAIFKHTLAGELFAFHLDVGNIGSKLFDTPTTL